MGGPYRTVCPAAGCANTGSGANADGQLQVRREQVRPRRGGHLEGALQLRLRARPPLSAERSAAGATADRRPLRCSLQLASSAKRMPGRPGGD